MRRHKKELVVTVLAFLGGHGVFACDAADPYGDRPKTETSGAEPASTGACAKPIEGKDPSGLPQCTGTKGVKGRCVPRTELGSFKDTFEKATCADDAQACVPDEVIKSGSKIELKKCKAVLDGEGRCFWPLAKDIIANYDLLKGATKDQCPDEQVCAPCVNPLDKKETGVCNTGSGGASCSDASKGGASSGAAGGGKCPQVEPILDAKTFSVEDCGSNMLCVDKALVGDQASHLKPCAKGVCAPKKSVERGGNYVPVTCRSTAGAEGRCLNVGIPMIGEQKTILPQEKCDPDERCAPCFDPRDGADTGACKSASCDAPKEPAKTFAPCCGGRARCVPTSAVGDAEGMLEADSCTGDTPLCAPVELVGIPGTSPKPCNAGFGLIKGICVSACAISIPGASLIKGDCNDGDMCAPCSKLPAGTKGCAAP